MKDRVVGTTAVARHGRTVAVALFVVGSLAAAACASSDASTSVSSPATSTSDTTAPDLTTPDTVPPTVPTTDVTVPAVTSPGVTPVGFDTVAVRVTPASRDGEVCEFCAWLADTDDRRRRGLMGVTDLGGPRAMAFVYSEPRTTNFTMRNTLVALSIAFFDESGAHVGEFDMVPCTGEPCPGYPTPVGFTIALEVPAGELVDLGIGPGARLELLSGDAAAGLCP